MRRMRDPSFHETQVRDRYAPHVAELNKFVNHLGHQSGGVPPPWIAPHYNPLTADALLLLSNPGPMASRSRGSGFLSHENDDPTAERLGQALQVTGMSDRVVPWNAYPWYLDRAAKQGPSPDELALGTAPLVDVLSMLPTVRSIVALGADAKRAAKLLRTHPIGSALLEERHLVVFETYHTSNLAFAGSPQVRQRRFESVLDALHLAGLTAHLSPGPGWPLSLNTRSSVQARVLDDWCASSGMEPEVFDSPSQVGAVSPDKQYVARILPSRRAHLNIGRLSSVGLELLAAARERHAQPVLALPITPFAPPLHAVPSAKRVVAALETMGVSLTPFQLLPETEVRLAQYESRTPAGEQ